MSVKTTINFEGQQLDVMTFSTMPEIGQVIKLPDAAAVLTGATTGTDWK